MPPPSSDLPLSERSTGREIPWTKLGTSSSANFAFLLARGLPTSLSVPPRALASRALPLLPLPASSNSLGRRRPSRLRLGERWWSRDACSDPMPPPRWRLSIYLVSYAPSRCMQKMAPFSGTVGRISQALIAWVEENLVLDRNHRRSPLQGKLDFVWLLLDG